MENRDKARQVVLHAEKKTMAAGVLNRLLVCWQFTGI
jgi:hypothetical protein